MPRPITALRWFIALYAYVGGLGLFIIAMWEVLTKGGMILPARAAPSVEMSASVITLIIWFAAAAYTGWRGMDREALS